MKLIVGLGNHQEKYLNTRHNLGFMVIDKLVKKIDESIKFNLESKFQSLFARVKFNDESLLLIKPITQMNLSGNAVKKVADFYKISSQDIWVISDDLELDFGKIRLRIGGSSGGHNGLKSVIDSIGEDFVRIRLGISNPELTSGVAQNFVLKEFNSEEKTRLAKTIESACTLIFESLENKAKHHTIIS